MDDYQARLFQRILPPRMDPADKDEGYSEDTRSQDGLDSPMKLEPGDDAMMLSPMAFETCLPHAVLALTEAERSGRSPLACVEPFGMPY